jgi:formiminotetrahydrofolate cyclodeaminase
VARPSYLDLTLRELCEQLEAETGPGGGSAAGVVSAMAAALITKAATHSVGSWPEADQAVEQADALAKRCVELARVDAEAYREALAALEEGEAIAAPLRRTTEVLLELAETAADVAALAARTAERGDGTLRSDAVSGAVLAAASSLVAEALIAVNLTVTDTDERLRRAHVLAEEAAASALRALKAGP